RSIAAKTLTVWACILYSGQFSPAFAEKWVLRTEYISFLGTVPEAEADAACDELCHIDGLPCEFESTPFTNPTDGSAYWNIYCIEHIWGPPYPDELTI
ncbi:MAG: hypothetical protein KDD44_11145, partial [Bdellovibrionales bacterium]|nr:hypothetical protein [Bdellovibrionales bacterium]